jgi:hypothetical protein
MAAKGCVFLCVEKVKKIKPCAIAIFNYVLWSGALYLLFCETL